MTQPAANADASNHQFEAFKSLVETTRTILSLASIILTALIAYISQAGVQSSLKMPMVWAVLSLSACSVFCMLVLLRSINSMYHNRATVRDMFFRLSYAAILILFLAGLAAGCVSVLA